MDKKSPDLFTPVAEDMQIFNSAPELDIEARMDINAQGSSQIVTTIDPNDEVAWFNCMNDSDHSVNDFIGKTIKLAGYFVHDVELTDRKTGLPQKCPRTILIDTDGKTYGCVAWGIFQCLERLVKAKRNMGPWPEGVPIQISQRKLKDGNSSLTFKMI